MRINNIILDAETQLPSDVTVTMSIEEAAAITILTGQLSVPLAKERHVSHIVTYEIYNALTGAVFYRFYDNGVNEFKKPNA